MSDITPILSDKACAYPAGLFHKDHAKVFNGVVYTTGQIGADVVGNLVSKDIKPQTEQVLKNLSAILEAAGSSLDRVIKVNIYMVDQTEYAGMNEVYKEYVDYA
ncbi:putative endoribonuclease l-psp protein [Botryosphaeria dothidea]|uniref:Putative endoribonuclease l-psp protein n=1 Tax=Botryosphaeria dothidea TaxID=55169 RepID=A0A8H4J5H9_9PEZI|nr:putative endoribonuclease l-psp protein [Botryosphaeria dothidea]KAF4312334.1 putative endoribonuclease l-psp protein [Botryosphaeria dothidea]